MTMKEAAENTGRMDCHDFLSPLAIIRERRL